MKDRIEEERKIRISTEDRLIDLLEQTCNKLNIVEADL